MRSEVGGSRRLPWSAAKARGRSSTRRSSCRSTGAARSCRSPWSTRRSLAWPTTTAVSDRGYHAAARRCRRPAGPSGRARDQVPRVLPPARSPVAAGHRGRGAVPPDRPDRLAGAHRPDARRAAPAREPQGHHRPQDRTVDSSAPGGSPLLRAARDPRRDVPPRLLASYSLDSAAAETEEVTVDLLRSTLRRTLDGVERMVEIRFEGRPPTRTPGPACRWCSIRGDALTGRPGWPPTASATDRARLSHPFVMMGACQSNRSNDGGWRRLPPPPSSSLRRHGHSPRRRGGSGWLPPPSARRRGSSVSIARCAVTPAAASSPCAFAVARGRPSSPT